MENETLDLLQVDRIIGFLTDVFEGFPVRESVDRRFFAMLALDFKTLDVEEELKQYHAWTLDQNTSERRINHHSRFRQWLKRAILHRASN